MNNKKLFIILGFLGILLTLTACAPAPEMEAQYDPATIRFSGVRTYEIEEEFVTNFQNRVSGSPESEAAVIWLRDQFTSRGWSCEIDEWEAVLYGETTILRNVVCRLPGESDEEILVLAHHDIAPTTVQGADNDGSGIAILLHLAEIFAVETPLPYTLVFLADDAEEYGSAFNPYWQARLVQTTNADRVLSIALQQKQTFGILDQIEDLDLPPNRSQKRVQLQNAWPRSSSSAQRQWGIP